MSLILDTHFLVWLTLNSPRVSHFPWLGKYTPWTVSPIALLEIQYLAEIGRLEVKQPDFTDIILTDQRFVVDNVPALDLVRRAYDVSWTRDPFDRLLVAHSLLRDLPLCTVDREISQHHRPLPEELV